LLEATLVGLYEPDTRRVLVASDTGSSDAETTRFHELAHALVDQHFDLESRVHYEVDGADRQAAAAALAEGDANSVMFDLMSESGSHSRSELVRGFVSSLQQHHGSGPPVLERLLTAPYVDGVAFVERLRREGGWSRVNDVWRDPPTTTEQVLHPEAYARREAGRPLERPPPPHPSCRELYSDVLGEQTLRCLLFEWVGDVASQVVAGWAGDRVTTFACPDGHWVMLQLATDGPDHLAGLLAAFRDGLSTARCLGSTWTEVVPMANEVHLVVPPAPACVDLRAFPPARSPSGSPVPR
jgi:hypothetical protein